MLSAFATGYQLWCYFLLKFIDKKNILSVVANLGFSIITFIHWRIISKIYARLKNCVFPWKQDHWKIFFKWLSFLTFYEYIY